MSPPSSARLLMLTPSNSDWDPTKWIVWVLHVYTPFVPSIARTPESAIKTARARVHTAEAERLLSSVPHDEQEVPIETLPVWSRSEVAKRHGEWVFSESEHTTEAECSRRRRILLIIGDCVVDVGGYLADHVSGFHGRALEL